MEQTVRAAILASGQGSNAETLFKFSLREDIKKKLTVSCLVSDNPRTPVVETFAKKDLPSHVIEYRAEEGRRQQEERILEKLKDSQTRWIFLAGYRRILSKHFLQNFYDEKRDLFRVLNIHPSLLPDLPGLNAYQKAFQEKREFSGVTVHFVDEGVDTGKIICQERFFRQTQDVLDDFIQRGKKLEQKLYPQAVKMILDGYPL